MTNGNACDIIRAKKQTPLGVIIMFKISKKASVTLSFVISAAFVVILGVFMCILPWFTKEAPILAELREYFTEQEILGISGETFFLVWAYILLALAFICCIVICMLLLHIRRGHVFSAKTASFIRFISWDCILIAVIFATAQYFHPLAYVIALAAAFLGLCLRVVKNIIEEAITIKDENDLTV